MSRDQRSPFISIVVPVYNDRENLLRCIESIATQSFRDFEVIVVDDASEQSPFPLSVEGLPCELVECSLDKNSGPAAARNRGISAARGEYITFLDSDDLYFPWTLEVFHDQLQRFEYPPVFTSRLFSVSEIREADLPARFLPKCTRYETMSHFFQEHTPPLSSALTVHHSLLKELDGFADTILWEEYDLVFRIPEETGVLQLDRPFAVIRMCAGDRMTYNFKASVSGAQFVVDRELNDFYQSSSALKAARRKRIEKSLRWYIEVSAGTPYQAQYQDVLARLTGSSARDVSKHEENVVSHVKRLLKGVVKQLLLVLVSILAMFPSAQRALLRFGMLFISWVAKVSGCFQSTGNHRIKRLCNKVVSLLSARTLSYTAFGSLVHNKDSYIHSVLAENGIWEPGVSSIIARGLAPGDTFIDIGANIGAHTLLSAVCVGSKGTVYAFEPEPQCFAELDENLTINGYDQVKAVQGAVGEGEDILTLHIPDGRNESRASLIAESVGASGSSVSVPVKSLYRWVQPECLSKTRMIKIDVEGFEWVILSDIASRLSELPTDCEFLVEMSLEHAQVTNSDCKAILEAFYSNGYRLFELENYYEPSEYELAFEIPAPKPLEWDFTCQVDVLISRASDQEISKRYQAITTAELLSVLYRHI